MSWFWSSPSPKRNDPQPQPSELKSDLEVQSPAQPPSPDAPSKENAPLTRDQQAFADLKSLISSEDVERTERAVKAKTEKVLDPDLDSLYPNKMSCAQCWDMAYACSSVAGQLRNVYRYGGARSCTELWAQWRFCMRTKAMSSDKAKVKIREWNQRKAAKYKRGRSSEDIWEGRDEEELGGDPFPFAALIERERELVREFLKGAVEREETVYWKAFTQGLRCQKLVPLVTPSGVTFEEEQQMLAEFNEARERERGDYNDSK